MLLHKYVLIRFHYLPSFSSGLPMLKMFSCPVILHSVVFHAISYTLLKPQKLGNKFHSFSNTCVQDHQLLSAAPPVLAWDMH